MRRNKKERKIKARLVSKGFHEHYWIHRDSPTVSRDSLKLFFNIAANKKFKVSTINVTSVFLQSDTLERQIFYNVHSLKSLNELEI